MLEKILYTLKWRLMRSQSFAPFDRLIENEKKNISALEAEREAARQALVRTAFEVTPFYRRHYAAAGFTASDIGKLGWFENLPIVTKQDLRDHFDDFVSPTLRRFMKVSATGGSTGTPTKTGYDGRAAEEIYSWRLQDWFGVHPWDDHAYIWRDTRTSKSLIKNNYYTNEL